MGGPVAHVPSSSQPPVELLYWKALHVRQELTEPPTLCVWPHNLHSFVQSAWLFHAQRVGGAQASRRQFLLYVSVHFSSEPLLRRVATASRRVSDMTA